MIWIVYSGWWVSRKDGRCKDADSTAGKSDAVERTKALYLATSLVISIASSSGER